MLLAIVNGAIVALGIGLLIFVHELGHFLVAKKVGIRVEAFSLGFGPRIWGFIRGGTDYKLCMIPLGGYVKMAGETGVGDSTGHPDEFGSKTIAQRAWVVSAGVIMNLLFAALVFPIAFGVGVPFEPNVIGDVRPGSPAWKAGLQSGDKVLTVDDSKVYGFPDIQIGVALSGDTSEMVVDRNGTEFRVEVSPEYSDTTGFSLIGIGPAYDVFFPEDAAFLEGLEGVDHSHPVVSVDGIPINRLLSQMSSYADLVRSDAPRDIVFMTDDGPKSRIVTAKLVDGEDQWVGVMRWANRLELIRPAGPAAFAGLQKDDVILSVNGQATHVRSEIERALIGAQDGAAIVIRVRRGDSALALDTFSLSDDAAALDFLESFHLATVETGRRVYPVPGAPLAVAGLLPADEIVNIAGKALGADDDPLDAFRAAVTGSEGPISVIVSRGDAQAEVTVTPELPGTSSLFDGIIVRNRLRPVSIPFPESVAVGFRQVGREVLRFPLFIKKIFTGDVAKRHVGGIARIATVGYKMSEQGFGKILFFLGSISVSLAVINILPIPILDGGHLVYLILEKIKGGPISERAMAISSWVGLALVLGLMAFATFNDIRWLMS